MREHRSVNKTVMEVVALTGVFATKTLKILKIITKKEKSFAMKW